MCTAVLFRMHRSHTEKAETRRCNVGATEEQEESMYGKVGHDGLVRRLVLIM
jgi:hypothetical protein